MNRISVCRLRLAIQHRGVAVVASILGGWLVKSPGLRLRSGHGQGAGQ